MTTYGSLNNLIIHGVAYATPKVGMGCTILSWTDRIPATIVSVSKSGKSFEFTYDDYHRTDTNGLSENQTYEYTSRPDGVRNKARLCKDKRYKCHGRIVIVGIRERYEDPHF